MTDSQKFTLIETTKKNIKNMGITTNITHNESVVLYSEHFEVVITKELGYTITSNKIIDEMNQEQWENYSAEIDNLDRAILWINTQLKSIVFDS